MITQKYITALIFFQCLLLGHFTAQDDGPSENEKRVREYVEAFNKKDVESMLEMVSPDVQWINITGDKLTVEARGKSALRKSLTGYFESAPEVRSELEWTKVTSSRVATLERAT